jgi:hypothetical protein
LYFVIFETTADQTLDGEQRVLRVGDGLALGRLTNQDFAVIGIGNDGRSGASPSAFSITRAWSPSRIATQELVVPRSIPMILPI